MLDIKRMKVDMEDKYQKAVEVTQGLECKYGMNEQDGYTFDICKMTVEDLIEYKSNLKLRYILFYFLCEYINPEVNNAKRICEDCNSETDWDNSVKCEDCGKIICLDCSNFTDGYVQCSNCLNIETEQKY